MSSPSSELSWLSSDEIEALQEPIEPEEEPEEQQPAWRNTWTPINQSNSTVVKTPPSPPLSQHDSEEDDIPSVSASYFRHAIIAAADRLYETKTARKRKMTTSPPSTRKRRAITTIPEDHNNTTIQAQEKEPPAKKTRALRKPRTIQPRSNDSLLPIRSSKLNSTFNVEKRTALQAFETEIESRPAKKLQTERSGNNLVGQSNIDSMTKRNRELLKDLNGSSGIKHHSDVENIIQTGYDHSEDLFDNDDTSIEEFLEFEKTLFAEIGSPFPSLNKSEAEPKPEKAIETLEKAPFSSIPASSPIKPFVRPFTPLPSSQDLPPAGSIVSPIHRSPICFRIAEVARYISHTFFASPTTSAKTLNLEVYAVLNACVDNGGITTITLADIFFPTKPPYLEATARQTTMALALSQKDKTSTSFQLERLKTNLIRAVIQVIPNSTTKPASTTGSPVSPINLLAGRYTNTVLKVEKTDWDEITRVKEILD